MSHCWVQNLLCIFLKTPHLHQLTQINEGTYKRNLETELNPINQRSLYKGVHLFVQFLMQECVFFNNDRVCHVWCNF